MTTIYCNNSKTHGVNFILNGGAADCILVYAEMDGEYWFSVGRFYKTAQNAKRAAIKAFAKFGYTFDAAEMEALVIE